MREQKENRIFHRICWAVTLMGLSILGLAISADLIGLSTSGGFGRGQVLFTVLGLLIVVIGGYPLYAKLDRVTLLARGISDLYRNIAIILLTIVVVCVTLECMAIALLTVERAIVGQMPQEVNPRKKEFQPYYLSQDWSKEYWQEYQQSYTKAYQPYIGWTKKLYRGNHIKLDSEGKRNTPGTNCQTGSFTILSFGGSSMWGTGSPDWGTIPAYLAEAFHVIKGEPVCVINLSEEAFVSTQGVIRLMLQLQGGVKPDLVIFYDGGNDVYASYQSGRAAVHQNLYSIANRFEGLRKSPDASLITWGKSLSIYKVVDRIMPKNTKRKPPRLTFQQMGVDSETLSNEVVECYLENYRLVQSLAQDYGFEFRFFLQPLIFYGSKPLTEVEQQKSQGALNKDKALTELFHSIYGKIQRAAPEYNFLYDLTQVFNLQKTQIWIDYIHVNPIGNKLVAEEMMKTVAMH